MIQSVKKTFFNSAAQVICIACFAIISALPLSAKTTMTTVLVGGVALPDQTAWENSFQDMVDKNGPAYANAYGVSNSLGYAIGKSTLGSFPGFEVGASLSAGLTNMENFQHSKTGIYKGSVPGIGLSPVVHFGAGLGGGFDFIGKIMSYNQDVYSLPIPDNDILNLKALSIYAVGGRVRYNYISEKTIIPFLFKFGGLTFSAGGDLMRGLFGVGGSYKYTMDPQSVEVGPGPTQTLSVTPQLDSVYALDISWFQLSGSVQATAYFDIMYFFSVYTGFGFSVGYGWFNFDFNADGTLTNTIADDPANPLDFYSLNSNSNSIGTAKFVSENKYHPQIWVPSYIIGLELNVALLKIVAESQVNLRNRADVTATLGVRLQI